MGVPWIGCVSPMVVLFFYYDFVSTLTEATSRQR